MEILYVVDKKKNQLSGILKNIKRYPIRDFQRKW
jgi:hypothetical protein